MRDVPKASDEAFYSGRRSKQVPFAVNDTVEITGGPHVGRSGVVISIESFEPEVTFLVELGAEGADVVVPAGSLKAI